MAKRIYTPKPLTFEARMLVAQSLVMTAEEALTASERTLAKRRAASDDDWDNWGNFTVEMALEAVARERETLSVARNALRNLMSNPEG